MRDEDELREDARRSREETKELRKETERDEPGAGPWAKTSSGDTDSITTDDDE
jgi:hypothetical protein